MFASRGLFIGATTLLFGTSVAATVYGCVAMSSMPDMQMPGGWTMSMAWMRMPGQGWTIAAASFIGMWIAMMVAMMLPVVTPVLWRYRLTIGDSKRGHLALFGLGYFCVWGALGVAIYPPGIALATLLMQQPVLSDVVPAGVAITIVLAGALQFTPWKKRQLARCRVEQKCSPVPAAGTAWRDGLHLGWRCVCCCAGQTAVLLVVGVMDWRAMIVVAIAIAAERLLPDGERIAGIMGIVAIVAGAGLLCRAIAFV